MSNYRAGIAVCNCDAILKSPKDEQWWKQYQNLVVPRYDTPKSEKEAASKRLLPMFLYLRGEIVFHWMNACERGDPILVQSLPKEHGALQEENRTLYYAMYGGDYWLNALFYELWFWEGLHRAGTRGTFVLEVGCEHSIEFQGFSYSLYGAAWPAWYLLVATLHDEKWILEKVYPDPEIIKPHIETDGAELESALHFFCKYEGRLLEIAKTAPHREILNP